MGFDFDLIVIGGGSGGVRCARMSAALGARVLVCESGRLGGTCVNVGCVPKKLMACGASYGDAFDEAHAFGWGVEGRPPLDWGRMVANRDREVARLNGVYERVLTGAGVAVARAHGRIVGPNEVDVGGSVRSGAHILIATGGRPQVPDAPGAEHAVSSDDVFGLTALPARVAVVGGGYVGVEFSSILRGYGAAVTLLVRGESVLRGFDRDVRRAVGEQLAARGVDLRTRAPIHAIERWDGGYRVRHAAGCTDADLVLCACGRVPNTRGLGLARVGVERDARGAVVVDAHYRTGVRSILAVGDVIGRMELTPVALAEGTAVARSLFGGGPPVAVDYANVPTAVFCSPPVGAVGLTEGQARARGDVVIYRSSFTPLKHTMSGRDEKTLVKLVVDRGTDRVLGFHMVGADAAEIIQGLAVALTCGVTKAQLDATIGVHPTSAEEFVTMRTPVSP